VKSRSLLQVLQAFASYVEVPEQDLREGRATQAFEHATQEERTSGRTQRAGEAGERLCRR
jgi:hypothetical protein